MDLYNLQCAVNVPSGETIFDLDPPGKMRFSGDGDFAVCIRKFLPNFGCDEQHIRVPFFKANNFRFMQEKQQMEKT